MKNSRKTPFTVLLHNILNFFVLSSLIILVFAIIAKSYIVVVVASLGLLSSIINFVNDFSHYLVCKKSNKKVHVISGENEKETYLSHLKVGTIVKVYPDDTFMYSGKVINGIIVVDESKVTGDSNPVVKKFGDNIKNGSTVLNGSAEIEVTNLKHVSFSRKSKVKLNPLFKTIDLANALLGLLSLAILGILLTLNYSPKQIAFTAILTIPSVFNFAITMYCLVQSRLTKKKGIQVNELTGLTSIGDFDILCLDKTGTITDGSLSVYKIVPWIHDQLSLNLESPNVVMSQIVSDVLKANNEKGPLFDGMNRFFDYGLSKVVEESSPYSKNGLYSAASFKGNRIYAIGDVENFDLSNKESIMNIVNEYAYGYKVLVLVESKNPLKHGLIDGKTQAIGAIVLEENIRKESLKFVKEAKERNIKIKVISGDSALMTSEIARQAGVNESEKAIDVNGMTLEAMSLIIDEYVVFGGASISQKEYIVRYLQEQGHNVAFIGDGDNDTQALKASDVSFAFESSSDSAKQCSQIILSEISMDKIESARLIGEKMKSNILRAGVLFYSQCILSIFTAFIFAFNKSYTNPLVLDKMGYVLISGIILPGLLLLINSNNKYPRFEHFKRLLISVSLMFILCVGVTYLLQYLQYCGKGYYGLAPDRGPGHEILQTSQITNNIMYLSLTLLGLGASYKLFTFVDSYSKVCFFGLLSIDAFITTSVVLDLKPVSHIVGIDSSILDWPSLYFGFAIVLSLLAIYLFVLSIIEIIRGE